MGVLRTLAGLTTIRRLPSRRALAALVKLHGYRVEGRWPFLARAEGAKLNMGVDDVLEFQYARSRSFLVMVIGAFDGVENDPVGRFIRAHKCVGIFVEPQPAAFARLRENLGTSTHFRFINAAVDQHTGSREFFYVPAGAAGLPRWTEQLGSFRRDHITKHERQAPGVSGHIESTLVNTISFSDLLDEYGVRAVDVLQIDAEGLDALLLSWFPFERIRPGVLHYETAHMSPDEVAATRARLTAIGYSIYDADSSMDEMAILL